MFNVPVELVYRTDEGVFHLPASIPIDSIVSVKPLDTNVTSGVESCLHPDLAPRTAILLEDGRSLTVTDHWFALHAYMDAYQSFDEFYKRQTPPDRSGPSLTLIQGSKCATSEVSTPA